jgi:hypothetical protein
VLENRNCLVPALRFITRDTTWKITQKRAGQLACSATLAGANEEAFEGGTLLEKTIDCLAVTCRMNLNKSLSNQPMRKFF